MNCDDLTLELAGIATGDATHEEQEAAEGHLRTCSGCRRTLQEVRHTIDLTRLAPLEEDVPEHLERDVFRFVELQPVAALVEAAPLEHDPPLLLERDAMERSGALTAPRKLRGWHRVAPVLAPGLAASLLILGFLGVNWYSDASDARERLNRVNDRFGPWGDMVGRFELAPLTQSTASWPPVQGQLMRLPRDHFGLVLHLEDYPPTPHGYVCQLWLVGEDGARTPLGAFTVTGGGETRTLPLEVPVDPRDFPRIEVTLEPVHDDEAMRGPMIMEATLDF